MPIIGGPFVKGAPGMPGGGPAEPPENGDDDIKGLGRAACEGGTAPAGIPDEGKPPGGATEPLIEGGIDPSEGLDPNG